MNQSVGVFHSVVKGTKTEEDLPGPMGSWVDVRDGEYSLGLHDTKAFERRAWFADCFFDFSFSVAFAHSKSLLVPEAGSQRFIVSAGEFCIQGTSQL